VRVAITCGHLQRDIELHRELIEAAGHEVVLPDVPGQELAGTDLIAAMAGIDGVVAGDDQFSADVLVRSLASPSSPSGASDSTPSTSTMQLHAGSLSPTLPRCSVMRSPNRRWAI
jgi:hypothetical protein